jgi:hypothetical protein
MSGSALDAIIANNKVAEETLAALKREVRSQIYSQSLNSSANQNILHILQSVFVYQKRNRAPEDRRDPEGK